MTEEQPQHQPAASPENPPGATPPGVQPTGHPAVDEVLRSMERLDERPVAEHVAAFEEAHEALRRSLADGDSGQD